MIRSMGRSQTKAAQMLGIKITTLNAKIKRYKIDLTQVKDGGKRLRKEILGIQNLNRRHL